MFLLQLAMGQVTDNDGETDDYKCREGLGTYQQDVEAGNGAAWVKCGCGQWIHDECVDKSVTGEDGKERMCCNGEKNKPVLLTIVELCLSEGIRQSVN